MSRLLLATLFHMEQNASFVSSDAAPVDDDFETKLTNCLCLPQVFYRWVQKRLCQSSSAGVCIHTCM